MHIKCELTFTKKGFHIFDQSEEVSKTNKDVTNKVLRTFVEGAKN